VLPPLPPPPPPPPPQPPTQFREYNLRFTDWRILTTKEIYAVVK
jgi:hypothetical protein